MATHDKTVRTSERKGPATGKAAPPSLTGLGPEQVAFLGESAAENVFVQVLCWPTISAAWATLTEAAAAMRSVRGGLSMSSAVVGTSWVQDVAPQLSRPLRRELSAAESTLATLIGRLPVQFALAVVEHEVNQRQDSGVVRYRSLLSGCLTAYDTYLKASGQHAVRVMIAPDQGDAENDLRSAVYGDMLPHMDGAERLGAMELAFWPQGALPLPMEVTQLAAAAVSRHLHEPTLANPLFEVIRAHLAPPSHFHALGGRKGRR
jgi:hypothetical protein